MDRLYPQAKVNSSWSQTYNLYTEKKMSPDAPNGSQRKGSYPDCRSVSQGVFLKPFAKIKTISPWKTRRTNPMSAITVTCCQTLFRGCQKKGTGRQADCSL